MEVSKFEDASLQAASVDLVVCSSAFHWLDRERALRQVVKVLKPGGALALIWGSPRRAAEDNRVDEAIQAAYRVHAPEISRQTVDRMGGKVDEIGQAVRNTPELSDFEERLFPQPHLFDRQRYVDTLATFSDHATLPAEQRARLFEAIGEIIDGQFGGRVERHSTARLQLARRREAWRKRCPSTFTSSSSCGWVACWATGVRRVERSSRALGQSSPCAPIADGCPT